MEGALKCCILTFYLITFKLASKESESLQGLVCFRQMSHLQPWDGLLSVCSSAGNCLKGLQNKRVMVLFALHVCGGKRMKEKSCSIRISLVGKNNIGERRILSTFLKVYDNFQVLIKYCNAVSHIVSSQCRRLYLLFLHPFSSTP